MASRFVTAHRGKRESVGNSRLLPARLSSIRIYTSIATAGMYELVYSNQLGVSISKIYNCELYLSQYKYESGTYGMSVNGCSSQNDQLRERFAVWL